MKKPLLIALASAALLPMAACSKPATTDTAANDTAVANAAPVAMPPAIKADKSFRCKDNSLAFVTFFEGDTQAVVKDSADGTPTLLKAATAGEPLVAEGGWSLTGDVSNIKLTRPGKPAVTCHV